MKLQTVSFIVQADLKKIKKIGGKCDRFKELQNSAKIKVFLTDTFS
ncbi:MAG: hypothetical protein JWR18_2 [Segetibacter sp.]|jgi:hypothetical protein|nr:hypothetical protein [Segetibacter sp.]